MEKMDNSTIIRFTKSHGFRWNDGSKWNKDIPVGQLARACTEAWNDIDDMNFASAELPTEELCKKCEALLDDDDSDQEDWDRFNDSLSAYAEAMTVEQLTEWFVRLNDPATILGVETVDVC